jgi:hypothetical protein
MVTLIETVNVYVRLRVYLALKQIYTALFISVLNLYLSIAIKCSSYAVDEKMDPFQKRSNVFY